MDLQEAPEPLAVLALEPRRRGRGSSAGANRPTALEHEAKASRRQEPGGVGEPDSLLVDPDVERRLEEQGVGPLEVGLGS